MFFHHPESILHFNPLTIHPNFSTHLHKKLIMIDGSDFDEDDLEEILEYYEELFGER
jgi:uncharacterized protein YfeS